MSDWKTDWREVGRAAAKAAPMLGTVLGGPVGGAIGAVVASALGVENNPDAVLEAIKTDPDAAVKLAQIEADKSLGLAEILAKTQIARLEQRTREIEAVNRQMAAEGASEHFLQWSWRPMCGYALVLLTSLMGITVLGSFGMVMLQRADAALLAHIPPMLASMSIIIGTLCAVVGVSAYERGREKTAKIARGINGPPTLTEILPSATR